ncbi:replication initiator protein A, partial [Rhodomicrobium vannielii ATCC 17100]|uniref:replication initiator protein A n=1 Tax=Rhodomicrobium vannielii TaxID=1069 RepID=UPI00191A74E8
WQEPVIKTTIETGDEATVEGFSLISAFKYNRKGSMHAQRLRYLEITLCEWLFRAIEAAEVLPISRDYFRLRRPLDRRLYELARKHCGSKDKWRIGIDKLQKKCGSKQERKAFVRHLRETVEADHIPDYALSLDDDVVVFLKRAEGITANRSVSHSPTNAYNQANQVLETPVAPPERRIMLSSRAMERVYEIAPRWDKHMLESMYVTWAKDKDAARDEDARFIGWVKSYTKGKAAP